MTHTVTHTAKCAERFEEHRAGSLTFLPGIFGLLACAYIICDMKLPIVSAAWSCIWRVAWV